LMEREKLVRFWVPGMAEQKVGKWVRAEPQSFGFRVPGFGLGARKLEPLVKGDDLAVVIVSFFELR
jgi:hypothetical protein